MLLFGPGLFIVYTENKRHIRNQRLGRLMYGIVSSFIGFLCLATVVVIVMIPIAPHLP